jgi:hypothetical protein
MTYPIDRRARLATPLATFVDPAVPAPVLRLPVISHAEVLRILADKPSLPKGQTASNV